MAKHSKSIVRKVRLAGRRYGQLSADCVANIVVACAFNGLQIWRQKSIECRMLNQNDAQILEISLKIHSKSIRMVPRSTTK